MSNETISIQSSDHGYRIISNAIHFNSLNKDYRTFTISFGKHLRAEQEHLTLPMKAIFFATSLKNSFEMEHHFFGAPHITEIIMNHHTKVSYKVKISQRSKEKHADCVEKTYFEVFEEFFVPLVKENCPNPCTIGTFPKSSLKLCDSVNNFDHNSHMGCEAALVHASYYDEWNPDFDFLCSYEQLELALTDFRKSNYSYKPCYIEEYEGKLMVDEIIDGMQDIFHWHHLYADDVYFPIDITPSNDAQNPTIKFSYTFDKPEIATVLVEDFIVTFVDLVGIVGGTLGMFIGFAFYDNIMTSVEYVITCVQWLKRMKLKRRTRKIAKAQVQEGTSSKMKKAKSNQSPTTKVAVETKKKNTKTTPSKEQTKDVKENKTKKNQVTNKTVCKPKPTTAKVVEENKPKDITPTMDQSKDDKANESKKIQVTKISSPGSKPIKEAC